MAEREQKQRGTAGVSTEDVVDLPGTSERGKEIKGDIDDLLDEIDGVLESSAVDFATTYRQKGGQ